ncbi:hypothetical protein C8F04DRAFT_1261346 [Mycena alexandri]|uniref:Uncharacterized protein n=1 Tax=Mycena alexandri TaxID=1745969 RepID=A0AAD6X286_9AGAR|nr:hypothetical protein C8F04DRAFT_1261346 [Mycena alexandri]
MSLPEAPVKDALDAQRLSSPQASTTAASAAATNVPAAAAQNLQRGEAFQNFEFGEPSSLYIIYSYDLPRGTVDR